MKKLFLAAAVLAALPLANLASPRVDVKAAPSTAPISSFVQGYNSSAALRFRTKFILRNRASTPVSAVERYIREDGAPIDGRAVTVPAAANGRDGEFVVDTSDYVGTDAKFATLWQTTASVTEAIVRSNSIGVISTEYIGSTSSNDVFGFDSIRTGDQGYLVLANPVPASSRKPVEVRIMLSNKSCTVMLQPESRLTINLNGLRDRTACKPLGTVPGMVVQTKDNLPILAAVVIYSGRPHMGSNQPTVLVVGGSGALFASTPLAPHGYTFVVGPAARLLPMAMLAMTTTSTHTASVPSLQVTDASRHFSHWDAPS